MWKYNYSRELYHYNHNHGPDGKFTSGNGIGGNDRYNGFDVRSIEKENAYYLYAKRDGKYLPKKVTIHLSVFDEGGLNSAKVSQYTIRADEMEKHIADNIDDILKQSYDLEKKDRKRWLNEAKDEKEKYELRKAIRDWDSKTPKDINVTGVFLKPSTGHGKSSDYANILLETGYDLLPVGAEYDFKTRKVKGLEWA